jgi:transcriptional regulator with XRE-family HTH domain
LLLQAVCMTQLSQQQFQKELGRRIATVRKKKGFTQEQLAEMIDVHRTYIGFIEQGVRNPSIGNIHKIADTLKVTLRELFKPF